MGKKYIPPTHRKHSHPPSHTHTRSVTARHAEVTLTHILTHPQYDTHRTRLTHNTPSTRWTCRTAQVTWQLHTRIQYSVICGKLLVKTRQMGESQILAKTCQGHISLKNQTVFCIKLKLRLFLGLLKCSVL